MGAQYTIPLHGTVSANDVLTVVSRRIDFSFYTRRIRVAFPPGTERKLQIKVFSCSDSSAPSSGEPHGKSLMSMLSDTDYVVGDNSVFDFPHDEKFPGGYYVKAYGNNTDGFEHTLDVSIIIEEA